MSATLNPTAPAATAPARPAKPAERVFSLGEEIANSISHGVGALLSVAGLVLLVVFAAGSGDPRLVVGYSVFGATLVILFAVSSVFHGLAANRGKLVMERLDYSAIYLLIAGSYTAFSFAALDGAASWLMFGLAWGIAVPGIVFRSIYGDRFRKSFLASYLVMGWLVAPFFGLIRAGLSPLAFNLLVAGGLAYTVGTIAFALQRYKWLHLVWHLFVLAGAVCHALAALAMVS
jgi:hemolysin III